MSVQKLTALSLLTTLLIAAGLFAGRGQARSSLAVVKLSTAQSEFHPGILNSGNWAEFGGGLHEVNNDNYVVGNFTGNGGLRVRNYFSFDASLLPGCARSASLRCRSLRTQAQATRASRLPVLCSCCTTSRPMRSR
jgi:hypothetical protein